MMWKKITAMLLLCVLICTSLVSCAKESEAPDGMQAAYYEGEPFRLYIPNSWTVNKRSGISGGYTYLPDKIVVNARYIKPADPAPTLDAYIDSCAAGNAATMQDFVLVSREPALLGGADAKRMVYTVTDGGMPYTCTQISAYYEGMIVSLYYYCPTGAWESTAETLEDIRANFAFAPLGEVKNDEVTDAKTPEGMKIASDKNAAHRLYVPKSWICYSESGVSEAYYLESGNPNVTVSLYEPQVSMSIDDYFQTCEKRYTEALAGYERLETKETTVAGRKAISYTYRARYDETDFRIMQTVFIDGFVIYSLTYTALEDRFDAHLADVEAILAAFAFY